MRTVARQQRQLDAGVADGDVDGLALMLDVDNVDVLVCEQFQKLCELTGTVADARTDDEVAPRRATARAASPR